MTSFALQDKALSLSYSECLTTTATSPGSHGQSGLGFESGLIACCSAFGVAFATLVARCPNGLPVFWN